ncbi:hypothetical protein PCE1_001837 [Barthelona sp. PCE]
MNIKYTHLVTPDEAIYVMSATALGLLVFSGFLTLISWLIVATFFCMLGVIGFISLIIFNMQLFYTRNSTVLQRTFLLINFFITFMNIVWLLSEIVSVTSWDIGILANFFYFITLVFHIISIIPYWYLYTKMKATLTNLVEKKDALKIDRKSRTLIVFHLILSIFVLLALLIGGFQQIQTSYLNRKSDFNMHETYGLIKTSFLVCTPRPTNPIDYTTQNVLIDPGLYTDSMLFYPLMQSMVNDSRWRVCIFDRPGYGHESFVTQVEADFLKESMEYLAKAIDMAFGDDLYVLVANREADMFIHKLLDHYPEKSPAALMFVNARSPFEYRWKELKKNVPWCLNAKYVFERHNLPQKETFLQIFWNYILSPFARHEQKNYPHLDCTQFESLCYELSVLSSSAIGYSRRFYDFTRFEAVISQSSEILGKLLDNTQFTVAYSRRYYPKENDQSLFRCLQRYLRDISKDSRILVLEDEINPFYPMLFDMDAIKQGIAELMKKLDEFA